MRVRLQTLDRLYDLGRHCVDWRPSRLSEVDLDQIVPTTPRHIELLLTGTVKLSIVRSVGRTCIRAFVPGPRMFIFNDDDNHSACIAMILGIQKSLAAVHTLEIPSIALDNFLCVLTALPELTHLHLAIIADATNSPKHQFGWHALRSLAGVQQHCQSLRALRLEVVCIDEQCPPAAQDALDLLAQLKALGRSLKLQLILVHGFPETLLRDINIPAFDTFRVEFT